MAKIHFDSHGTQTTVSLYTGEAWSDENKNVIEQMVVDVNNIPDAFDVNGKPYSLKEYGFKKIIQDRTSDTKDKAEKFAQMKDVAAQLVSGTWRVLAEKAEKAAAPRKGSLDVILVEALARITGRSQLSVSTSLLAKTKEERAQISASPKVVAMMAEIRAELETQEDVDFDLGN